jgi:hypothetical protein
MIVIDKIKKHYFLLLNTFLFFYVFFNLLYGERGLISYFEKKEQYKNMQNKFNNMGIRDHSPEIPKVRDYNSDWNMTNNKPVDYENYEKTLLGWRKIK